MASIQMITEERGTGRAKEIYDEIKAQLGIDFVPNLYKVMAAKPEYLAANGTRSRRSWSSQAN